ncbi:MAG: alpha/beta fold hydrolase [Kiritimatiellae bacterium]|nr:alpha/beta fold hydrolase [Kiritimatiellia bacterium]
MDKVVPAALAALVAVAAAVVASADEARSAAGGAPVKIHARELTVPLVYTNAFGETLPYRYAGPENPDPGGKYPLVILLHGAGERGSNNVAQLVHGATDLLNYMREKGIKGYFLAGQCPVNEQWVDTPWGQYEHRMNPSPTKPMSLMMELVERTVAEKQVDASRVLVTGISMGGYGTWDIVQRRPEWFAGAMPCCGGGDAQLAWKIRKVPIWAFHGAVDSVVPVERSRAMVAALWAVNGDIRYTEYPGVNHGSWVPMYADWDGALAWFFSRRRGDIAQELEAAHMTLLKTDSFLGHKRYEVDFIGWRGWIVEPKNPAPGRKWVWCMKWPGAFPEGTGQTDALERGYYYVYFENTKWMNPEGTLWAKRWRDFLVNRLGFAAKTHLIGMSWGGFFSARYASTYPEDVADMYLDGPVMGFHDFNYAGYLGKNSCWTPEDPSHDWLNDPLMPVNRAGIIAAAKLPILLLYGAKDATVRPAGNCELFLERLRKAGGDATVIRRDGFGHHPHGFTDKAERGRVVDFFSSHEK